MNGVPLLVVAKNLGHADTRMVEKHYGHLAPSYIADAIRAGAPRFGMVESSGLTAESLPKSRPPAKTATPPQTVASIASVSKSIGMPANRNLSERGKRELAKAAR